MTARDTHQLADCDLGGCDICLSYWELMHLMLRRVRRPAALEAALAQITELQTENNRLRAALAALERWDMLALDDAGHGVATADAPWARQLIADALAVVVDGAR